MAMLSTLMAFLVALALLIAVHEWGHYRMAVACGVKVLRFSIGFGPTVLRYISARSGTEYVLAALPLGGYVRMLDEREGEVATAERHLAFNTQPLFARALIVGAGPVANLLLAVLLYSVVNWMGTERAAPILSVPGQATLARLAALQGGETVIAAGLDDQSLEPVRSFDDVRWWVTKALVEKSDLSLSVQSERGIVTHALRIASLVETEVDPETFARVGIVGPKSRAVIGDVVAGDSAAQSGVLQGDLVLQVDGAPVIDAAALRATIRNSARSGSAVAQRWLIERDGRTLELTVTPRVIDEAGTPIGRVGAAIGSPVERVLVRYGWWDGLTHGVYRVGEIGLLSLRMMGRMVLGEASLKNLSGPVAIADYAGKSASAGISHYLLFLALISVSLGVLNLLPIPVLDGGHLMYYLWEWLTGHPPTERWTVGLQRAGVAMLATMMGIAMWNDLSRLFF